MVNLWNLLPVGSRAPETVYNIVEVPRGSKNKYELIKVGNHVYFSLERVLHSPLFYNGDYGIIPQTLSDDGEPLDIITLTEEPTFPGCVIESRPVAALAMLDNELRDDKIIAVPVADSRYNNVKSLNDISPHIKKEIAHFFKSYKEFEGRDVEILGWKGPEDAKRIIVHCMKLYDKKVRPALVIR